MSRGLQRERDLVTRLRQDGWFAMRSPASKGDVDVVAIKRFPERTTIRFYEVKSTKAGPFSGFGPADRKELLEAARLAGANPILCWWPPRGKPQFLPSTEWPKPIA